MLLSLLLHWLHRLLWLLALKSLQSSGFGSYPPVSTPADHGRLPAVIILFAYSSIIALPRNQKPNRC